MHRIMNSASQAARALFFILLAGMAVHVAAQEADRVKRMTLTADLDINVSGKVTAVAVQQQGIAEEVRQLVAQNAKQWAFEPVLVDNAPVAVRTRAVIDLRAEPVPGGYALHVRGVGFGNRSRATQMAMPEYPRHALRNGASGEIVLLVEYGPDGHARDARVVSSAVGPRRRAGAMARLAGEFESAAKNAALQWQLQIEPEVEGGEREVTAMLVPFSFSAPSDGFVELAPLPGRSEVAQEVVDRVAARPRSGNQPVALQSRVRLKQDVVGSIL